MQDMIILGLLQFEPMSAYDIKKKIERTTSNFYNASMGSIHPALKKLLAKTAVSIEEKIENGRLKKIYSINDSGRKLFDDWLAEGICLNNSKDPTLAKVFFLGFTDKSAQIIHLKNHLLELEQEYGHLTAIQDQLSEIVAPAGFEDHLTYQMATLDYGIEGNKFMQKWYAELLTKIEN